MVLLLFIISLYVFALFVVNDKLIMAFATLPFLIIDQTDISCSPYQIAQPDKTKFADESEERLAEYLKFRKEPFEYERKTFPLAYDIDGRLALGFTPDFYLPRYNLNIELTTMKQELSTLKHKKIRLLKQMFPEEDILLLVIKRTGDRKRVLKLYDGVDGPYGIGNGGLILTRYEDVMDYIARTRSNGSLVQGPQQPEHESAIAT